jgi:N-acetylneuraminate synthase
MDVTDLKRFRANLSLLEQAEGETHKSPLAVEAPARKNARRSIVLTRGASRGAVLTEAMLTCKRPGSGVSPMHWDAIIGRVVARNLREDHILKWEDLGEA